MRRGIAIGLLVAALLMVVADRQQKSMLPSGRLAADSISARVMSVLSAPVRGIETFFVNTKIRVDFFKENKALRAEIEKLRENSARADELNLRLRILQQMLDIEDIGDVKERRIYARSISEINGPFAHSALINAGTNKQVYPGYAVMTSTGLYGHVVHAGKSSARALLLNDLSSRISVMSMRSLARAIMIGNGDKRPGLQHIPPDADWQFGDRVVTSGDGGVLPMGLPIGEAIELESGKIGVKLLAENRPVDWIWVLPFEPIEVPAAEEAEEAQGNAQVPLYRFQADH